MMSKMNEDTLRKVLDRYGIDKRYYSIGEPAEQRVCIEEKNGVYYVYIVERGIHFEESYFLREQDAHMQMLFHLSENKIEYEQMCQEYRQNYKEHMKSHVVEVLIKQPPVVKDDHDAPMAMPKIEGESSNTVCSIMDLSNVINLDVCAASAILAIDTAGAVAAATTMSAGVGCAAVAAFTAGVLATTNDVKDRILGRDSSVSGAIVEETHFPINLGLAKANYLLQSPSGAMTETARKEMTLKSFDRRRHKGKKSVKLKKRV